MPSRQAARTLTESAHASREEILESATAFLSRRRFRDLTVARLMESTANGRSTFYTYFTDLYQLVEELLVRMQQNFLDAAAPWLERPETSVDGVRIAIRGVVDVWRRYGRMLIAIMDASTQDARLERAFRRTMATLEGAIAGAIEREQEAGRMREIDAAEGATALNQLDLAYLGERFGRARRTDPAAVLATLEHIWISTLYPDGS